MKEQHCGSFRSVLLLLISMLIALAPPFGIMAQQPHDSVITPAPSKTQQTPTPAPQQQQGREVQETEIVNTDLILLNVTVTDTYGRSVAGLDKEAFKVFEGNEEQEITFFSDDEAPVSIGILFDISGSMDRDKIERARRALSRFMETGHNSNEYFLITFNWREHLLVDKTRDGDDILKKLTFIETEGDTALYDAVFLGTEKVTRGTHPKRALLLISDGQDNTSRYTFSEVRYKLRVSEVVLYSLGILGGNDPENSQGMGGAAILNELSAVSGGKAFFLNIIPEWDEFFESKMGEFLELIALQLGHHYSIGYKPKKYVNDGKWHKLKVEVTPPHGVPPLLVRSREGYYAITNTR